MKPGGGRNKGAAFEREIVKTLKPVFPDAHRTAPMQAGHARRYADLGGTPGWRFELGHGKKMNPARKWAQVAKESGDGHPVAVTRIDRGETLVTMSLDSFLTLLLSLRRTRRPVFETWGEYLERTKPKD